MSPQGKGRKTAYPPLITPPPTTGKKTPPGSGSGSGSGKAKSPASAKATSGEGGSGGGNGSGGGSGDGGGSRERRVKRSESTENLLSEEVGKGGNLGYVNARRFN